MRNFYDKLVDYLLGSQKKEGKYVIKSETVLEMAKEELIARGDVVPKEPERNLNASSEFKDRLAEYFERNVRKKSQTNYWYLINTESILEMAKEELLKRGAVINKAVTE